MDLMTTAETVANAVGGTDIFTSLQGLLPESTVAGITAGVTICAAVATLLPAPKTGNGKVYRAVYSVVNWIACNLGKAKNAQDAKPQQGNWRR